MSAHAKRSYRVGFHYRCGDQGYRGREASQSQCVGHGTARELGECGLSLFGQPAAQSNGSRSVAFIASDNSISAKQIGHTVHSRAHPLITPKGCHIDYKYDTECTIYTIVYWFILSLSDHIVTQFSVDKAGVISPFSSFSRFAATYSLQNDIIRYARNCKPLVSNAELYRVTSGNWKCE